MRKLLLAALLLVAACARSGPADLAPALLPPGGAAFPAADSAAALHLLDRFAFGPRPGDIAHVEAVGIRGWLAEQLDPARLRDTAGQRAMLGNRALAGKVMMSALARHIASERQLLEVMTDFWTNHFNIFMNKEADRWLTADFVEHAIRPQALGRFEDLLVATAMHPAMMIYLDNAQSVAAGAHPLPAGHRPLAFRRPGGFAPMFAPPLIRPAAGVGGGPTGINENYARELLELHTLGVDGGYTQQDVIEVARILTGWGVTRPRPMGIGRFGFEFHEWAHDYGAKTVMGIEFPAGHGMDEGKRLLRILAESPATARHVSAELCVRFVADTPPDGCVDAAVAAWQRTGGDIRAVLVAIAAGPDFWAPENRTAKFKTPLQFLVSAVRAIGGEPDTTARLAGTEGMLGEPLFQHLQPDGYPDDAAQWLNSGAILSRMNVALALASGRMPGVVVDLDRVCPATRDYDALVRRVNAVVLAGQGSDHTLQVIREQLDSLRDPASARATAIGLALGSPDFQRL